MELCVIRWTPQHPPLMLQQGTLSFSLVLVCRVADDQVTSDKLTSQSAVSLGHCAKTLLNLSVTYSSYCNLVEERPWQGLMKWVKVLHQVKW